MKKKAKKKCIWCKVGKDITEFSRNKSWKSGISARCRQCEKQYRKDKYWKDPVKFRTTSIENFRKHRDAYVRAIKIRQDRDKDVIFIRCIER